MKREQLEAARLELMATMCPYPAGLAALDTIFDAINDLERELEGLRSVTQASSATPG